MSEDITDEWKAKYEELQAKLQTRDAKEAWTGVLGPDGLHPKVTIEKVWAELGYTPGEVPSTPEEIAEQLANAREQAPYLFAEKKVETTTTKPPTKPPLKETAPAGRGAPDTGSSRVRVTRTQLQDPKWKFDPANSQMLSDASARGVLDIVEG